MASRYNKEETSLWGITCNRASKKNLVFLKNFKYKNVYNIHKYTLWIKSRVTDIRPQQTG